MLCRVASLTTGFVCVGLAWFGVALLSLSLDPTPTTHSEAHYTVEALASSGQLVAMDMVEVNPRIGTGEQAASTVKLANSLITSALGETIL